MKVYFLQRFLAYFIDSLIVLGIVTLLTVAVPVTSKYEDALKDSENTIKLYMNGEITDEEYVDEYGKMSYIMAKETLIISFVNLVVLVAYYGSYSYYKNGQTLGKKWMKFKINGASGEYPSHLAFVVRSMLIHGVVTSLISLVALLFIDSSQYYSVIGFIDLIYILFFVISLFMIMFRKDGRGLHDIVCKTKVVGIK